MLYSLENPSLCRLQKSAEDDQNNWMTNYAKPALGSLLAFLGLYICAIVAYWSFKFWGALGGFLYPCMWLLCTYAVLDLIMSYINSTPASGIGFELLKYFIPCIDEMATAIATPTYPNKMGILDRVVGS